MTRAVYVRRELETVESSGLLFRRVEAVAKQRNIRWKKSGSHAYRKERRVNGIEVCGLRSKEGRRMNGRERKDQGAAETGARRLYRAELGRRGEGTRR